MKTSILYGKDIMKGETKEKIFIYFLVGNTVISLFAPLISIWLAAVPFFVVFAITSIMARGGIWMSFDWAKEETYSKFLKQNTLQMKTRLGIIMLGCVLVSLFSLFFCIIFLGMEL